MTAGINSANQAVEEFINITTSMVKEKNLNDLLNVVVNAATQIACAEGGMIFLLDSSKRQLSVEVAQYESLSLEQSSFPSTPLYLDGGTRNMSNLVACTTFMGEARYIENIRHYTGFDFVEIKHLYREYGYDVRSVTAIPLHNHERITIGVLLLLNIYDPDNNVFIGVPDDLKGIVNAFAAQAAVAIDNVQLVEKNRHLLRLLDNTNKALVEENEVLRSTLHGKYDFSKIVGNSPAMRRVFSLMEKIIDADATVLIRGETGSGKEVIAHSLHYNSRRKNKPFITQNCAALPEHLLESELFGYKRGAFSGAVTDKKGLVELADNGTLFLDEIGDMSLSLQAKLLRVLQDKVIRPLGGSEEKKINVRFIAATHCNLKEKIEANEFREDLFYRLCVFPIDLPSLAERKEDIPLFLHFFLEQFISQYQKQVTGFSPAALELLIHYEYPGNVRLLRNIVERAVLMCEEDGYILPEHLPEEVLSYQVNNNEQGSFNLPMKGALKSIMDATEAGFIHKTLMECSWNQTKAAAELKIARRTLIEKIKRHSIVKGNSTFHINRQCV